MCHWLEQCRSTPASASAGPQLLVCAPTNKAVYVLIERFAEAIASARNFNIAIVGDAECLLGEKYKESLYYQYCIYNLKSMILEEFKSIQETLSPASWRPCMVCTRERVNDLMKLFRSRIPNAPTSFIDRVTALHDALSDSSISREEKHKLSLEVSRSFRELLPEDAVRFDFMKTADIIFCTLCSSGSSIMRGVGLVPTLIVDEAAAATEPNLYIPFHIKPTRMLIVGDPKQLPAVVLSDRAKKSGLAVSLHERLMLNCGAKYSMLTAQYRMHPSICDFPSRQFYEGKLVNGANVFCYERKGCLFDGRPFLFLHVEGREQKSASGSPYNVREARAVASLVKSVPSEQRCNPDKFRIITFYRAQVQTIRQELDSRGLRNVLVSTVDSAQGCESDIVVISFVRSDMVGFLKDDRRMNVALTRARYQLVCVGNIEQFDYMNDAYTVQELGRHAVWTNSIVLAGGDNSKRSQIPQQESAAMMKRPNCAMPLAN
jgi:AAA domain